MGALAALAAGASISAPAGVASATASSASSRSSASHSSASATRTASGAETPAQAEATSLEAAALASKAKVKFGITDDGNGYSPADVQQYIDEAGKGIDLYSYDRTFLDGPFELSLAKQDSQFGRLEITLESKDYSAPTADQPAFTLARIISGSYDSFLTGWADSMKAYGSTIYLRFDDEMNGNWYPWGYAVNGNQPGQFVAAWRHVHNLFVSQGATNVKWVWAPNVDDGITGPPADFYPGSSYVDVVGLDGYNYGNTEGNVWQTPDQIFDSTLAQVQALAPGKPIWITETGSTESGGSKAAWFGQFFSWLSAHPVVSAVIYEDMDQDQNWRIDSSPNAMAAYHAAVQNPGVA